MPRLPALPALLAALALAATARSEAQALAPPVGAPARVCDWMMRPWAAVPIADPAERARVYAALGSSDGRARSCAVAIISARTEFREDVSVMLGPPDPATGLRPPLPGVDPEQARVLEVVKALPMDQAGHRWEGAGPAGRFAVLTALQPTDPAYCAILHAALFDPACEVERMGDTRRSADCPIRLADVPALRASPSAHTRGHALEALSDALPRANERELPRSRCQGEHIGLCQEITAKPAWRWSRDERQAAAILRDMALHDPDEQLREDALDLLDRAHLDVSGPQPPSLYAERIPDDAGCGGE